MESLLLDDDHLYAWSLTGEARSSMRDPDLQAEIVFVLHQPRGQRFNRGDRDPIERLLAATAFETGVGKFGF